MTLTATAPIDLQSILNESGVGPTGLFNQTAVTNLAQHGGSINMLEFLGKSNSIFQIAYDTGVVDQSLHSSGNYNGGPNYSGTYNVTNNYSRSQNVEINVTFFYGSHVQTNSTIYRSDGTLLYQTGQTDWNFLVVYHTTQYRTFTAYDTIPAGSSYGYYAGMQTYYNGDYDYSRGPNGFYQMTINYTSYN